MELLRQSRHSIIDSITLCLGYECFVGLDINLRFAGDILILVTFHPIYPGYWAMLKLPS